MSLQFRFLGSSHPFSQLITEMQVGACASVAFVILDQILSCEIFLLLSCILVVRQRESNKYREEKTGE